MSVQAFVISLTDNHERRHHMAALLKDQGIQFKFFDACDGRGKSPEDISSHYLDKLARKRLGYRMIGSQVAIAVSHLTVYRHILSEGFQYALIMEDDIRFSSPIRDIIDGIDLLPAGWDVVMLCYYRSKHTLRNYVVSPWRRHRLLGGYRAAFFTQNMHSTAAYLISAKGAARLVASLEGGFCEPIDHYVGNIRTHHLYAITPKPVEIDLQLGLASNVSRERLELSGQILASGDRLRLFLRRIDLFPLAKQINLARLEWQKPISQALYMISHPWLLFRLPKSVE